MLCGFLLHNEVNQLYVYVYISPPSWTSLPSPCHPSQSPQSIELSSLFYTAGSHKLLYISVQFSRSVMSNSLRAHEPQHARPPCPSPTPRVHPNPRPLSRGCHPAISSSVVPFSSCPQSFPNSGSFHFFSHIFTFY